MIKEKRVRGSKRGGAKNEKWMDGYICPSSSRKIAPKNTPK
jgi:hypothetical protein